MLSVFTRRESGQSLKDFNKIIVVHEPHPKADLVNREVGLKQIRDGFIHPDLVQIMNQGASGLFLKSALT